MTRYRRRSARELREETGLRVEPEALGPCVAVTSGYADLDWAAGVFRDDCYFHRVPKHDVDTGGFDHNERRYILGHRWWPSEDSPPLPKRPRSTPDSDHSHGTCPRDTMWARTRPSLR